MVDRDAAGLQQLCARLQVIAPRHRRTRVGGRLRDHRRCRAHLGGDRRCGRQSRAQVRAFVLRRSASAPRPIERCLRNRALLGGHWREAATAVKRFDAPARRSHAVPTYACSEEHRRDV
jgi:hypothetical protein